MATTQARRDRGGEGILDVDAAVVVIIVQCSVLSDFRNESEKK